MSNPTERPATKVGDTVWVFDTNRRVYPKPENGNIWSSGGPIWREHWGPHVIVAETSRSWVLGHVRGRKVPKKGANPRHVAFSQAEIDEQAWVNENRQRLARVVEGTFDASLLRKVAAIIGYTD